MNASKNILKAIQRLKLPKFRKIDNEFFVEGDKLVNEAIVNVPQKIKMILATNESKIIVNENVKHLIYSISDEELKKISSQKNPQNSIAVIEIDNKSFRDIENEDLILCCDDIQDPGNFGTIIRTADWFGITTIFASKKTVDIFNQKVIQASMGSIFRVHVEYVDLKEWLEKSNRIKIGAILGGETLSELEGIKKCLLIIGNEGKGISDEIQSMLDKKITIPGYGKAESLNAAVATGIILAELTKYK